MFWPSEKEELVYQDVGEGGGRKEEYRNGAEGHVEACHTHGQTERLHAGRKLIRQANNNHKSMQSHENCFTKLNSSKFNS